MQQTKTVKINSEQGKKVYNRLIEIGFSNGKLNNPYLVWRLEGNDVVVMYYTSGSLVAQGVGELSFLDEILIPSGDFTPHIGNDEVGKGDYFGPLVVCSVYVDQDVMDLATKLGVMDSKKISDDRIESIFKQCDSVKYRAIVVSPVDYAIGMKKYNNVSIFLSTLHAKATKELLEQHSLNNTTCVVDQFSSRKGRLVEAFKDIDVKLVQFHKGESDIAVAMASVCARAIFLEEWKKMNAKYSLQFPKGASDVIPFGKEFVKKYGQEELKNVAKISFKTTSQILSAF